jgi:hypothetical protein
MNPPDTLARQRAILAHFDSYSAALLFARWDNGSLLWPAPLPEDARLASAAPAGAQRPGADGDAVRTAMIAQYGFNAGELIRTTDFEHWAQTAEGPVSIHLLRFTTPEAPRALLEAHGAGFRHMTQLRGADMKELLLLREVFNLIVGGNARA